MCFTPPDMPSPEAYAVDRIDGTLFTIHTDGFISELNLLDTDVTPPNMRRHIGLMASPRRYKIDWLNKLHYILVDSQVIS